MEEKSKNGQVRRVKRLDTNIRIRNKDSSRNEANFSKGKKSAKNYNFIFDSLEWLSRNYILINGLRNWTWKVIIDGIILEN